MNLGRAIDVNHFFYDLPDDRIARYPLQERDQSRLLIYRNGRIEEDRFQRIADYIDSGSLLILNNTRVIPARLLFNKTTGAEIEIFLLEPLYPADFNAVFNANDCCRWKCLVGNVKKWKSGELVKPVSVNDQDCQLSASLLSHTGEYCEVGFSWNNRGMTFREIIENSGEMPIPPYLKRRAEKSDKENYQTLYSCIEGSVAAPTAGLHFTERVFQSLKEKNIAYSNVTLHVAAGTFRPVQCRYAGDHEMHTETFSVSLDALRTISGNIGQVVAVGTTSVRTLESLYWIGVKIISDASLSPIKLNPGQWDAYDLPQNISPHDALYALMNYLEKNNLDKIVSSTRIMIVPEYSFRMIKGMITNYHLPESTLLMLVAAFTGDHWRKIYDYSLNNGFRFLSYGDCSLLYQR